MVFAVGRLLQLALVTTIVPVSPKQNVRDKVGPLEDNAGDIITQGFLMAEELNIHFSSVLTCTRNKVQWIRRGKVGEL